jgi:two-component system sensor histidine kinase MprB
VRRPWRTLRGRLTLLTTAAVALAVTAACFSAFLLVHRDLIGEVDKSLRALPVGQVSTLAELPRSVQSVTPRSLQFDVEVLGADGNVTASPGPARLTVTGTDRQLVGGGSDLLYDAHDSSGVHVRILVRHSPGGGAIMVARPLTETDRTLNQLRWLLIAVAGAGVLAATGLGLLVARAGIKPVDRLTEAAERIARTERAEPPLPVAGSDELSRLGRAFNAMVTALAASRDRQRLLILDAGHELRTPVTVLQTNIELLRRAEAHPGRLPPDQRAALLADLDSQVAELSDLVGGVIELSRDETGPADHLPVDLRQTLSRAIDRIRLRAAPTVTFTLDADDTVVSGDPAILERAFVNVLDNAVKFGPSTQSISVRLTDATVTVADEGSGIATEDLPHVFDRFYRAASSRQLPGSGLGLAIVSRAAQIHGATVSVEPGKVGGTVVMLDFTASAVTGHT